MAAAAAVVGRVALVTGANKGIGLATVKALAAGDSKLTVLLGSRDTKRGEESVKALGQSNVLLQAIDIDNEKSIEAAAAAIKSKYGGLDILINNAGIAWKGDAFDETVARGTIGTNYYGTLHAMKHFLPIIKANGRVVNVSSMAGANALRNMSAANREKFLASDLTESQLSGLMEQFIGDVKAGDWSAKGWPKTTYGVSKAGVTMLTRIAARDNKRADVLINSLCPGWVKTDMAGDKAPKTPAQGAETPVHLALLPAGSKETGLFWENKAVSKYF